VTHVDEKLYAWKKKSVPAFLRILRLWHARHPFPHCGGKPVCGFSRNLWWLNVRSGRRCNGFIDLATSIAASSNKLDYDFMSRRNYVNGRAECWSREKRSWISRMSSGDFPPSHHAISFTVDCQYWRCEMDRRVSSTIPCAYARAHTRLRERDDESILTSVKRNEDSLFQIRCFASNFNKLIEIKFLNYLALLSFQYYYTSWDCKPLMKLEWQVYSYKRSKHGNNW